MYIVDHTSKSFMPELLDFGMYQPEKPVAIDYGNFISAAFKKVTTANQCVALSVQVADLQWIIKTVVPLVMRNCCFCVEFKDMCGEKRRNGELAAAREAGLDKGTVESL